MKVDYKFKGKVDLKELKAGMVFSRGEDKKLWMVTNLYDAIELVSGEVVSLNSVYFKNFPVILHPDAKVVNG